MFDVESARKSGYTDDEIIKHLTETRKFDVEGAKKSGYGNEDIIKHLSSTSPLPQQTPVEAKDTMRNVPVLTPAQEFAPPPDLTPQERAEVAVRGKPYVKGLLTTAGMAVGGIPGAVLAGAGGELLTNKAIEAYGGPKQDVVKDVLKGGGQGAIEGVTGKVIGRALPWLAEKIPTVGKAIYKAGITPSTTAGREKLIRKGEEKIGNIVETGLDKGIKSWKDVPTVLKDIGERYGALFKAHPGKLIPKGEVTQAIDGLKAIYGDNAQFIRAIDQELGKALKAGGPRFLTAKSVHELKTAIGKQVSKIQWGENSKPVNEIVKDVYGSLNEQIAKKVPGYTDLNKEWGAVKDLENLFVKQGAESGGIRQAIKESPGAPWEFVPKYLQQKISQAEVEAGAYLNKVLSNPVVRKAIESVEPVAKAVKPYLPSFIAGGIENKISE